MIIYLSVLTSNVPYSPSLLFTWFNIYSFTLEGFVWQIRELFQFAVNLQSRMILF